MLKVVIADDEARVCRLVRMLADWNALGMEVAGTASNGLEALELVETLRPDILITDIRMPGCDGLELIRRAKRVAPHLEIALISGYAQFEYAQTAMEYDVGGYLLKPIQKQALTATLEKLGAKCRERAASDAMVEDLRQDSRKSQSMLQSRLLEDLLHQRAKELTREQLAAEYGLPVREGWMQVFVVKLDCDPAFFHSPSMAVVQKEVEAAFRPVFSALCPVGVFRFEGAAGYGILHYEAPDRDPVRRALRQCLNRLEAKRSILGPVEFSLAVGGAVDSPRDLPRSMEEAQNAAAERLVEGTGRLLEASPAPSGLRARNLLDRYGRTMEHAVDTLSVPEADRAAEELAREAERTPDVRGYELLDLVLAAGRLFAMRIRPEEASVMAEFREHCALCGSAGKLFDGLRGFQRTQIEWAREERESEETRPIRIAKQYIQQHFSEPITLEDVCAATGFSTSYFSTLFKKETGEGFSKYLTRVRMERAKTLLQETNSPVAEVCERVGYSDIKHFTGTFKKTTGLNPGQYRKLYG